MGLSSVTLVGEADRKMLKAAIKHGAGADQVRHRVIPQEAVSRWAERLNALKEEVVEILKEEKEEKHVRLSFLHPSRAHCVSSFVKQRWKSRKGRI